MLYIDSLAVVYPSTDYQMISTLRFPSLIIPNGAAVSNVIDLTKVDSSALAIQAPAALDAVTYEFQASIDGVTYADLLDSAGDPIVLPAASQIIVYNGVFAGIYLRINASGNSAAAREFMVSSVEEI